MAAKRTPLGRMSAERCEALLSWLLDNMHLITVNIDAGYCDTQEKPSAIFRSVQVCRQGRPWNAKGGQRRQLLEALEREMNHEHKWETVLHVAGFRREMCSDCRVQRDVDDDRTDRPAYGLTRKA